MTKRILIFGTYPIVNPQHGGQQRVNAIVKEYRAQGLKVKYVGVFLKDYYPDYGANDIPLNLPEGKQSLVDAYTTDIATGKRIYEDIDIRNKIVKIIDDYKPELIELEQFFPYYGIKPLLSDMNWNGRLIYNSQNIEADLKKDILLNAGVNSLETNKVVRDIEKTELDLVKTADLVLACTKADLKYYNKNGAKLSALAPNGIHKRKTDQAILDKWKARMERENITKLVLFIGSAHPPNLNGYIKMLGFGLGMLPANSKLMFLGGVSDLVSQRLADQPNYITSTFGLRAEFLGRVSEEDLGALLNLAHTIILPITEGGGSNLKTAEAILSGANIVATSHAFRSYEDYLSLSNIYIADTKTDFQKALSEAVEADRVKRNHTELDLASRVTWGEVLKGVAKEVKSL